MHPRAQELVSSLELNRHPEGGWFREAFRSTEQVASSGGDIRPAATHIYFLLEGGEHSRWHRVAHDEIWNAYEGDTLELAWLSPAWDRIERRLLGRVSHGQAPTAVVPAGCWQRALTLGAFSLAGCTVAPGFDFDDFKLLSDHPEPRERLIGMFPDEAKFLAGASS